MSKKKSVKIKEPINEDQEEPRSRPMTTARRSRQSARDNDENSKQRNDKYRRDEEENDDEDDDDNSQHSQNKQRQGSKTPLSTSSGTGTPTPRTKTTFLPFYTQSQYKEESRLSTEKYLQRISEDKLKLIEEMRAWRKALLIPDEEVKTAADEMLKTGVNLTSEGLAKDAKREVERKRAQWEQLELDDLIKLVCKVD